MIDIRYDYPDWGEIISKYQQEINLFLAAQIQTNRGMMFDAEGADNGKPKWAPLKFRNGMILSKTGALRKSWAPMHPSGRPGPEGIVRFKDETIIVGTRIAYAKIMNDGTAKLPGGVIRAKGKALKIPISNGVVAKGVKKIDGGNVIFRKSVKIPARPMDLWTQEDEREISEAMRNKIVEVLNRG